MDQGDDDPRELEQKIEQANALPQASLTKPRYLYAAPSADTVAACLAAGYFNGATKAPAAPSRPPTSRCCKPTP